MPAPKITPSQLQIVMRLHLGMRLQADLMGYYWPGGRRRPNRRSVERLVELGYLIAVKPTSRFNWGEMLLASEFAVH